MIPMERLDSILLTAVVNRETLILGGSRDSPRAGASEVDSLVGASDSRVSQVQDFLSSKQMRCLGTFLEAETPLRISLAMMMITMVVSSEEVCQE